MPPSNLTWQTATEVELSNCPFVTTQNVHEAGTTYTVWYKIVNDLGRDAAIVTWFYGTIPGNQSTLYSPDYDVIVDPDGPNEEYIIDAYPNCATEFPIKSGVTYYVHIWNRGPSTVTPAVLNINLSVVPFSNTYTKGHVIITAASNDGAYFSSQGGLQAGIISPVNGIIENTIPFFTTSEFGDVNPDGKYLFNDNGGNIYPVATVRNRVVLYDASLQFVKYIDLPNPATGFTFEALIRTCNATKKFWIGISGYSGAPNRYTSVDTDGNLSGIIDLPPFSPGSTLASLAATNSESHLLICPQNNVSNSIRRWNLSTLTWDTDFAPRIPDYTASDILVLPDDSVVIIYSRRVVSDYKSILIKRYNSGGTIINDYPTTTTVNLTSPPRIGYSFDPAYFWLWMPREDGTSIVRKIKVSDGTYAADHVTWNVYSTTLETMTPALRYTSDSCPIVEIYGPPSLPSGIYFVNTTGTLQHDRYYVPAGANASDYERKIPNPTVRTAVLGE